MSDVYAIVDLDGYASQMRIAAAQSVSEDDGYDLDEYISLKQMINLVEEFCLGHDDQDRLLLNEETNEQIFEETAVWIHSVGLAKLAAQDLVECAWDDNFNEMVFWTKEKPKNDSKPKSRRKNKKNQG